MKSVFWCGVNFGIGFVSGLAFAGWWLIYTGR